MNHKSVFSYVESVEQKNTRFDSTKLTCIKKEENNVFDQSPYFLAALLRYSPICAVSLAKVS
jgi:hypothetical protein